MPGNYIALEDLINYIERSDGQNTSEAELYISLLYCSSEPGFKLFSWNLIYIDLIVNYSLKSIINTLLGIINTARHDVESPEYVHAMNVLENIKPFFSLALLTESHKTIKKIKLLDKKYETLSHCFLDNPRDNDCDFLKTFGKGSRK